jgi:hypothetical protein
MKLGTRSVLYGYHAFWFHPWTVAIGWWKLYRLRRVRIGTVAKTGALGVTLAVPVYASLLNYRLWLAFFLHDLGYWGKPNMDGAEGETHPEWAAKKMRGWFGESWGTLCLYHSRFYAKRDNAKVSALCYADKLAITFYPEWLMVRLVSWTGEVKEYMKDAKRLNEMDAPPPSVLEWFRGVKRYVIEWVEEHKDGREDTWTPNERQAVDDSGTWK